MTLKEEQAAFDRQLEELLRTHAGKYVLFQGGQPVEFFDDHATAYEVALKRFGLGATFLIARVAKTDPQPVSFAWDAGVMVG